MKNCFFSDASEVLPIPCTKVVHDENRLGRGTIWGDYPDRCHVESVVLLTPGFVVSLSLHSLERRPPHASGVGVWSCPGEFGIQFSPRHFHHAV